MLIYHRITRLLAATACLGAACSLSGSCNGNTSGHRFSLGVTEQVFSRAEDGNLDRQLMRMEAMAAAGAEWVRLTLHYPFAPHLVAHIHKANELGVNVLVHLESASPRFYSSLAVRRPGNYGKGGVAWDSYRLSDIDPRLAEQFIREFFLLLKTENIQIGALEIFNEMNWNAFNGDLPLVEGGLWIGEETPWEDPVFTQYRAGMEKVGKVTQAAVRLNREILDGSVKIISCGQVGAYYSWKTNSTSSAWMKKAQGALVSHDLTLKLLQGKHLNQVDAMNYLEGVHGIGVHLYPNVPGGSDNKSVLEALQTEIGLHFDPLAPLDGKAGTLPLWITECGFRRSRFTDDSLRLQQFRLFCQALDEYDREKRDIEVVLIYNFGPTGAESADYALWEDGNLLPAAEVLR